MKSGRHRYISREDFGDAWPFTVPNGVLSCSNGAVLLSVPGTSKPYAINGLARSWAKSQGWDEVQSVWLYVEDDPLIRKDLGPVIELGLSLCD